MVEKNNSKFVSKGKVSFAEENSAFLANRGEPETGKVTFTDHPDAFLAKRGEPEKGSVTFKDNRYK